MTAIFVDSSIIILNILVPFELKVFDISKLIRQFEAIITNYVAFEFLSTEIKLSTKEISIRGILGSCVSPIVEKQREFPKKVKNVEI